MKKHSLHSGILKGLFAALLAFTIIFSCFGCAKGSADSLPDGEGSTENSGQVPEGDPSNGDLPEEDPPLWASNFELPDREGAISKLYRIYGGADKVFLLQANSVVRMPCPQGEVITVNATFDIGEYARLVLEDSIAEFNEVFEILNPNYKFAINYAPAEEDFEKKYSVRLNASDSLASTETSQVFGVAHVSYYNNFTELGDFGITIKSEVFNNGSYLMTTFKHELMHLLGAGDAYKNSAATKATVMQSYTVGGYHHLSATDVAFLDALYRNPEFAAEDEKINAYIDGYEENCLHTRAELTARVYHGLVGALDPQEVIVAGEEMGYRDLTEFSSLIVGGISPDISFGSRNISFKEIEYAETPAETYFGSIEPENHTYWHGRQTSLGSSQGIKYTDYGSGLLYAEPNGNLYTLMIKTGEYVLSFRLFGSFTNFADLSLKLWHISKCP